MVRFTVPSPPGPVVQFFGGDRLWEWVSPDNGGWGPHGRMRDLGLGFRV